MKLWESTSELQKPPVLWPGVWGIDWGWLRRSCPSSLAALWHSSSLLYLALDRDGGRWSDCSTAKPCAALWHPNKVLGGFKRHQPEGFLERLCARGSTRGGTTPLPKWGRQSSRLQTSAEQGEGHIFSSSLSPSQNSLNWLSNNWVFWFLEVQWKYVTWLAKNNCIILPLKHLSWGHAISASSDCDSEREGNCWLLFSRKYFLRKVWAYF